METLVCTYESTWCHYTRSSQTLIASPPFKMLNELHAPTSTRINSNKQILYADPSGRAI
jgi:hypothetical protein